MACLQKRFMKVCWFIFKKLDGPLKLPFSGFVNSSISDVPNTVVCLHQRFKKLTVLYSYTCVLTNHGRDISRGIISRQKSGRVEIEIGEASPIFWQFGIGIGEASPIFWQIGTCWDALSRVFLDFSRPF